MGALFYAAVGAFECPKCGKIPRREFPPDVRRKMIVRSAVLAGSAIVIFLVVFYFSHAR